MPLDIEEELTFTFEHDPRRAFEILQPHSEVHTLLDKWGLLQGTQLAAFRFNEAFPHRGLLGPLLSSLFASSAFRLNVLPADGRGGALNNGFPKLADEATHMPVRLMGSDPQPSQGSSSKSNAESITVVPLVSRETTLQLFDRLVNGEIVRQRSRRCRGKYCAPTRLSDDGRVPSLRRHCLGPTAKPVYARRRVGARRYLHRRGETRIFVSCHVETVRRWSIVPVGGRLPKVQGRRPVALQGFGVRRA